MNKSMHKLNLLQVKHASWLIGLPLLVCAAGRSCPWYVYVCVFVCSVFVLL